MFTVARLVKVHHYLYWRHLKVTNVKIAYAFLTVRDRHMVTMKHYWEVDIGLSESAKNRPWMTFSKVQIERSILTVAPRPKASIDKNVHRCPLNESAS